MGIDHDSIELADSRVFTPIFICGHACLVDRCISGTGTSDGPYARGLRYQYNLRKEKNMTKVTPSSDSLQTFPTVLYRHPGHHVCTHAAVVMLTIPSNPRQVGI